MMKILLWKRTRLHFPLASLKAALFLPKIAQRRITTRSAQKDDETFTLPSGRVLGYAEYGCPTGYPLLFFHGFPSSRLEGRGLAQIGHQRNLRIISPDRPGFGLSTLQPNRRITDWPADIESLAKHLKMSRFAILGGSGGGPYALACAHSLPRGMMSAVGVMAGAGLWESGTQVVPLSARTVAVMGRQWPSGLTGLSDGLIRILRSAGNSSLVTRWIDDWLKKNEKHQDVSHIEEVRKQLLRTLFEGFAQGSEAFVQESQLLTARDWGFRFEDVSYGRIQMWHGTKDKNAPIRMARYMSERLPNCILREFEDDTHFTLVRHLEGIVSDLVPDRK